MIANKSLIFILSVLCFQKAQPMQMVIEKLKQNAAQAIVSFACGYVLGCAPLFGTAAWGTFVLAYYENPNPEFMPPAKIFIPFAAAGHVAGYLTVGIPYLKSCSEKMTPIKS